MEYFIKLLPDSRIRLPYTKHTTNLSFGISLI